MAKGHLWSDGYNSMAFKAPEWRRSQYDLQWMRGQATGHGKNHPDSGETQDWW